MKAPNWIHHLELDWEMYYAGMLGTIASRYQLIRFDSHGNGLSDWDMPDITLDLFVEDLKAVFNAADIERAPIFSLSQGCAVAASFAVKYPERVSGLCFLGSFAQGPARRSNPPQAETSAAIRQLASAGWHDDYPSVRDHVAQLVIPDASPGDQRQYAEQIKKLISPENFVRFRAAVDTIDVVDLLPKVNCPSLVMHGRDDRLHPIDQGRMMAAGIPGARFIAIPTRNHLFPDYDPAWPIVEKELVDFLASVS